MQTATGGLMIVGAYPSARFESRPSVSRPGRQRLVPIADNLHPFAKEEYFDGVRVRRLESGKGIRTHLLEPLGLVADDCWITDLVKVFLYKPDHVDSCGDDLKEQLTQTVGQPRKGNQTNRDDQPVDQREQQRPASHSNTHPKSFGAFAGALDQMFSPPLGITLLVHRIASPNLGSDGRIGNGGTAAVAEPGCGSVDLLVAVRAGHGHLTAGDCCEMGPGEMAECKREMLNRSGRGPSLQDAQSWEIS